MVELRREQCGSLVFKAHHGRGPAGPVKLLISQFLRHISRLQATLELKAAQEGPQHN